MQPNTFARPLLRESSKTFVIFLLTLMWGAAVLTGFVLIWKYENKPELYSFEGAQKWPVESGLTLAVDHPTLVMLAHPKCPCTRASIGELEVLMAQAQGKLNAYVLFIKPEGAAETWTKTDLWERVHAIPGVQAVIDEKAEMAKYFKGRTSGQVYLYDPAGDLQFAGGITLSRGHSGSNPGRNAIVSYLYQGKTGLARTAAFGCPLFSESKTGEVRS